MLLLSRNFSYRFMQTCVVAEITTHIRNIPIEVPLGRREGLRTRSVANFDNVRVFPIRRLSECAGTLSPARVAEVKQALGWVFDWSELKPGAPGSRR